MRSDEGLTLEEKARRLFEEGLAMDMFTARQLVQAPGEVKEHVVIRGLPDHPRDGEG